jgi:hypothetical protein
VENAKAIGGEEIFAMSLSAEVLNVLSFAISSEFEKHAGVDVILALIELAVKLSTSYQKVVEKWAKMLTQAVLTFLDSAVCLNVERVLPSIVPCLLLDFLPASKSITATVTHIREEYIGFCHRHLTGKPDLLVLVIKHILENRSTVIAFLLRMSRSAKS